MRISALSDCGLYVIAGHPNTLCFVLQMSQPPFFIGVTFHTKLSKMLLYRSGFVLRTFYKFLPQWLKPTVV